jgi:hypothetical protein
MSSTKTIALSAGIAVIIAVSLIAVVSLAPGFLANHGSTMSGQSGTLSVMMTDPPTVPTGTSDVYMTYNKMGVHIARDGNQSQYWDVLSNSGTIDLMKEINVSQTLGINSSLPSGRTYNAIGFNVSNVVVTYNGVNYTAYLVYGHNKLFVPIPGGISVSSTQAQVVLIDMSPKILLLGSPSNPAFAFIPSAEAFVVPSSQAPAQSHVIGGIAHLDGDDWWSTYIEESSFAVTGVKLTSNSLSVNVTNTGNTSIVLRMVALTGETSLSGGEMPPLPVSAVFVVENNASLTLMSGSNRTQLYDVMMAGGLLVPPHSSVTLNYVGNVKLGLFQLDETPQTPLAIVSGENYVVRVIGADRVAASGTTAS